ncbi:MAG: hypothetical protein JWO36_5803 [Myxococcales bacterium]|nr:hypothetical protein [Myxococcales bacterium]
MTLADRRGYARFSLGIGIVLLAMTLWVAAGYGFPGGSVLRRTTGVEGPTGGLTTAMRAMLRGDFRGGYVRHHAAPWMFAYLIAQLAWRTIVVVRRPDPKRLWIVDLVASLTLFAAAIYVPWFTR